MYPFARNSGRSRAFLSGILAHYCPHSHEVADAVRTLDGLGFIDQSTAGMGSYAPMGVEVKSTDYKLNAAGMAIARE